MDDPKVLSQNLRFLRSARRLTQRELADLAGLGRATVCRLERGESAWRPATVARLARALKVPPEELTGAPYQRNILPSAAELKMELVEGILTLDEKTLHRLHPLDDPILRVIELDLRGVDQRSVGREPREDPRPPARNVGRRYSSSIRTVSASTISTNRISPDTSARIGVRCGSQ